MKVLIVSQYFWPESFKINDLAIDLLKRGYKVTVLTGKPNYPQGKFYKGYSFFRPSYEVYRGIKIYRVPLTPRGNSSGIKLAFNYLSFVFFSCFFILFHRQKYDITFTFGVSPITQAYAALFHKKLFKSKSVLWMQDLWPESVVAAGGVSSKTILNLLEKMVKHIYTNTDKILVQSEAFIPSILDKMPEKEKIVYIPNWAEDLFNNPNTETEKYVDIIPEGFIIMFAGNIGEAQDFNSIIKAAERTKNYPDIKWVIVGDGRKKNWVEKEIEKLGLEDTFFLLGKFPVEDMPSFFSKADLMLLSLKDEYIFSLTIPSKLQSYMAFGKPVVAMINGIGAEVVAEAGCGYISSSGDYISLAENVINAYLQNREELEEKGKKGKEFSIRNFSKEVIIDKIIDTLNG